MPIKCVKRNPPIPRTDQIVQTLSNASWLFSKDSMIERSNSSFHLKIIRSSLDLRFIKLTIYIKHEVKSCIRDFAP